MSDNNKTYSNWCSVLKKEVILGWYDKYCECGAEIVGVPKKK